ncbi:MAG TPA: hypothetical protein VFU01_18260 [Gemmatimonadaceae bacterium]|nr:hypothetical protein [Gemmatimonadaceae bacterium]
MADERRKGPPDRRRSRATKPPQNAEQATTSATAEEASARDPETARFDAEELDASIRARQHEDRGEVL